MITLDSDKEALMVGQGEVEWLHIQKDKKTPKYGSRARIITNGQRQ